MRSLETEAQEEGDEWKNRTMKRVREDEDTIRESSMTARSTQGGLSKRVDFDTWPPTSDEQIWAAASAVVVVAVDPKT